MRLFPHRDAHHRNGDCTATSAFRANALPRAFDLRMGRETRTRIKTLTSQTRRDNARFFGGEVDAVPQHCLTQGIGTILEARHIVLVASGRGKAEAVHQLVEGSVSAMWPATALQLHPHVTVLLDTGAASRLQLASYYIETYQGKPSWQGF